MLLERREVQIVEKRQWHQLKNPRSKGEMLVEVQTGACKERDIERKMQ
jgi:hypothetical protein